MIQTMAAHIPLVNEKDYGVFFRCDSRWVRSIIKHRNLCDCRPGPLDMNHLLAPIKAFAESPHSALDYNVKPARLLSGYKQYRPARKSLLYGPVGERPQLIVD